MWASMCMYDQGAVQSDCVSYKSDFHPKTRSLDGSFQSHFRSTPIRQPCEMQLQIDRADVLMRTHIIFLGALFEAWEVIVSSIYLCISTWRQ